MSSEGYVKDWISPKTSKQKEFYSLITEGTPEKLEHWLSSNASTDLAPIAFYWELGRGRGNALHLCSFCGEREKVRILIEYAHRCGMRLSQPDKAGNSAESIARKKKKPEIVELFKLKKQKSYQQKNEIKPTAKTVASTLELPP